MTAYAERPGEILCCGRSLSWAHFCLRLAPLVRLTLPVRSSCTCFSGLQSLPWARPPGCGGRAAIARCRVDISRIGAGNRLPREVRSASAGYSTCPAMSFRSLAPKSVTAPVAMGIAERIGGVPALAAVFAGGDGMVGALSASICSTCYGSQLAHKRLCARYRFSRIGAARALQGGRRRRCVRGIAAASPSAARFAAGIPGLCLVGLISPPAAHRGGPGRARSTRKGP